MSYVGTLGTASRQELQPEVGKHCNCEVRVIQPHPAKNLGTSREVSQKQRTAPCAWRSDLGRIRSIQKPPTWRLAASVPLLAEGFERFPTFGFFIFGGAVGSPLVSLDAVFFVVRFF